MPYCQWLKETHLGVPHCSGSYSIATKQTHLGVPHCSGSYFTQSKWTNGSILTKIIGTYKSEMTGNSAGNDVTLHEFHSLLICNGVK